MLVRLTSGDIDFSVARSDGHDLRFVAADGVTMLDYEREIYDAAGGSATCWVRLPFISSVSDTVLYLYYGNKQAIDSADSAATWGQQHVAVWHLNSSNGTSQDDSTGSDNSANIFGTVTEGVPGVINSALGFSGSTGDPQYLATPVGSFPTIDTSAGITFSAWAYPTNIASGGFGVVLDCGGSNWSPYWHSYFGHDGASLRCLSRGNVSQHSWGLLGGGFTRGTWSHIAMTVIYDSELDESTMRIYINGVEVNSSVVSGKTLQNPFSGRPLVIGAQTQSAWPANDPRYSFKGLIDEVHFSNTCRSPAWIAASCRNQRVDSTLLSFSELDSSWSWYRGWRFRQCITLDSALVDDDLTNFPLLVRLNSENFNFDLSRSDGDDIRFTAKDGVTPLSFERELHDNVAQQALYWARLPQVSAAENTAFYIYYGNDAASDGACSAAVWDADHMAVWHLSNTSGTRQGDSTTYERHLECYGAVRLAEPGVVGSAISVDSTATPKQYLANPPGTFPSFSTEHGLTFAAWAYPANPIGFGAVISCGGSNWPPYWHTFYAYMNADYLRVNSADYVAGRPFWQVDDWGPTARYFRLNTWSHVVLTLHHDPLADATTCLMYINGEEVSNTTSPGRTFHNPFAARPLALGARIQNAWPGGTPDRFFDGHIDEARVSNVDRSAAWIAASYNNQMPGSAMLSFGNVEPPRNTLMMIR